MGEFIVSATNYVLQAQAGLCHVWVIYLFI